jgi:Protein of unknown function (DUF664)
MAAAPWEPPIAGTEAEQLVGALDRLRTTFRWKAGGLDAAGLQTRVGASAMTLGGLLKHLALVEAPAGEEGFGRSFSGLTPRRSRTHRGRATPARRRAASLVTSTTSWAPATGNQ